MRTNIIQIGNSSGIILPANVLRKFGLSRKSLVDIDFTNDNILIKPVPRQGWAEAFKALSKEDLDEKFFPDFFEDEDLSWWQWEEK
jgi:antitoxin MazE